MSRGIELSNELVLAKWAISRYVASRDARKLFEWEAQAHGSLNPEGIITTLRANTGNGQTKRRFSYLLCDRVEEVKKCK